MSKKQSIFDRLNDPKTFTGAHKHRFDADGKGLGINQTLDDDKVTDLSNIMRPGFRTPSKSPHLSASNSSRSMQGSHSSKSVTSSKSGKSAGKKSGGPSIFDRLNDPKTFTGAHKHRFDASGKGLGINQTVDSNHVTQITRKS